MVNAVEGFNLSIPDEGGLLYSLKAMGPKDGTQRSILFIFVLQWFLDFVHIVSVIELVSKLT